MTRNESLIADLRSRIAALEKIRTLTRELDGRRQEVTGLSLEARALVLAALQERSGRRMALIVPGDASLQDFETALRLFHPTPERVGAYPTPSLSPYQDVAHSLSVTRDEIRTLGRLVRGELDTLIIPARALFRRLPDPEELSSRSIAIRRGDDLEPHDLLARLVANGFVRTDLVGEPGELAFRGGILDLFPPNEDQPFRIELFGDTVDSIRVFDPETQRSADARDFVSIEPTSHFPLTRQSREELAHRMSRDFPDPRFHQDLAGRIERIRESNSFPGLEEHLSLVHPNGSFFDLWSSDSEAWLPVVFEPEEVEAALRKYDELLRSEYEAAAGKGRAVYPPDRLLVPFGDIQEFLGEAPLAFGSLHFAGGPFEEIRLHSSPARRYVNRLGDLPSDLRPGEDDRRHLLFVSTRGGREKIERLMNEFDLAWVDEADSLRPEVVITGGELAHGFDLDEADLTILSEWDLFEPPTDRRAISRRRRSEPFLSDLRDLKIGDYVVHVDHGVGRFAGLESVEFGEGDREVMILEYSSQGRLLLPMENLNLIQKYSAGEDTSPRLDRLGGTSWARTKASVKKAMRKMADELIELYATRSMIEGHSFSPDSPWQLEFENSFEFDETEDQDAAISEVKRDMESRRPMDRLLCGDVGYGKTEVGMRAAFKAVMDGKQVAILAPTTILAYQHYQTLLRRFASFPVIIELLTRYRSPKEQKEIARRLESGEIDIVIGTHRILSRDISFRDLGLLVIDEEQRFGVAQKERLKRFRKSIDVVSMSATPIPRTLNMSLSGIRDISVIETPPKDRLAIQTAVVSFDDDFIREAIEFETGRGGQVFFVHNRIESIYAMKEYLERLVPDLRVVVGHGQMEEHQLEEAMMAFIERKYDVLLATTIIENGIDIPSCNTILINHAERFGLSQLYQLRGRVGRSDRLAFCYLLVPSAQVLSSDARKRLSAIQEFSDLGAGFRIAARDLEIRGSGNLLGGEQSGHIAAVGFEMYCRLLEEAVAELRGEPIDEIPETAMNLGINIYIPEDYIGDENLRMTFYKRIASTTDPRRLDEIRSEMRDRFGAIPEGVESLLRFARLRQHARSMGVVSITRKADTVAVRFQPQARVDPNRLLKVVSENPAASFSPAGVLTLRVGGRGTAMLDEIEDLLGNVELAA